MSPQYNYYRHNWAWLRWMREVLCLPSTKSRQVRDWEAARKKTGGAAPEPDSVLVGALVSSE